MLHHENEVIPTDRGVHELEVDSMAYVVDKYFGTNGLSNPNYLALHGATVEAVIEHLERIRNTAAEIIPNLEQEVNGRAQAC